MALDTFTKVGFIVVIVLLVVIVMGLSDYVVKIEPKPTTTTMVTTQPAAVTTAPVMTTTITTTTTSDCSKAGFKFVSGSYSKSNSQLTLTLENTKSVDLTMEYVFLTYPTGVVHRKKISGLLEGWVLEGHRTRSFLISQVEHDFRSGRITTNCPDVTVEFTYSDVT